MLDELQIGRLRDADLPLLGCDTIHVQDSTIRQIAVNTIWYQMSQVLDLDVPQFMAPNGDMSVKAQAKFYCDPALWAAAQAVMTARGYKYTEGMSRLLAALVLMRPEDQEKFFRVPPAAAVAEIKRREGEDHPSAGSGSTGTTRVKPNPKHVAVIRDPNKQRQSPREPQSR